MAGNLQSKLNSLAVRAARGNPELLDVVQELINEVTRLGIAVDPPPISQNRASSGTFESPDAPNGFSYSFTPRNVILTWSAASSDFVYYELRKGDTWDTATRILVTAERQAILEPLLEGTHNYLLKSVSLDGQYSGNTLSLEIIVLAIGAVNITSQTIDQNVLLYWNEPAHTFEISHYIVTRNGDEYTRVTAEFAAIVELVGDIYLFGVIPVDIAGNEGPESTISVDVLGPPDFILRDEFFSDLSGTKVNAKLEGDRLILPINLTETYAAHFTSRGWTSPQSQVTAGYPIYIQPGTTTASYKETFDVGIIYPSSILSIAWNVTVITGAFTIGVSTRVSDDGISWSAAQLGQNIFVESVRFIEVTVNFTGGNDAALAYFYNFSVHVSVKESMDSGEISALSTDPSGTFVTFNIPFKDVQSITLTAEGTTGPFTCLYDFNDVPNPTGFSVYVFNAAGVRQSKLVSWKARGII